MSDDNLVKDGDRTQLTDLADRLTEEEVRLLLRNLRRARKQCGDAWRLLADMAQVFVSDLEERELPVDDPNE